MRQNLFTTHFLAFERRFHSAVWLRVGLGAWSTDRAFQTLKKLNKRFRAVIAPLPPGGPDPVHEELYARYRESLEFEPAPTLRDLLNGDDPLNRFPTWQIDLFDGPTLVASGIFDRGVGAAAGITSYYDPDLRRHSLGRYLIYLKMEFCRDQGLTWFYPGYFAPGEPRFDYKLGMGAEALEYLELATGQWVPFEAEAPRPDPLAEMTAQLEALAVAWEAEGPLVRRYLHLDINLNPHLQGIDLFDFPVFLDLFPGLAGHPPAVVVFDPRDGLYHLLHLRSVYKLTSRVPGPPDPAVYESDLLHVVNILYSTEDARIMAAVGGSLRRTP